MLHKTSHSLNVLMQNICGLSNPLAESEEMLSPSKLAAQRIYSTARKQISFHSALRSSTDDLAALSSPPPSPQHAHVPAIAVAPREYCSTPAHAATPALPPAAAVAERGYIERQLLADNAQQFQLIQRQIDVLREMIVKLAHEKKTVHVQPMPVEPAAPAVAVPQLVLAPPPPPLQETKQPDNVTSGVPYVTCVDLWVALVFAIVFLIGLVRIIEWLAEKLCLAVAYCREVLAPKASSRRRAV
jgi:hypothetical protein